MQIEKPFKPVWGCKAIAKVIGRTERQTYHLLETGRLKAKKYGQIWAADEYALRADFPSSEEAT